MFMIFPARVCVVLSALGAKTQVEEAGWGGWVGLQNAFLCRKRTCATSAPTPNAS